MEKWSLDLAWIAQPVCLDQDKDSRYGYCYGYCFIAMVIVFFPVDAVGWMQ